MIDKKKLPYYITESGVSQQELLDIIEGNKIEQNIDSTGNQIIDTSKKDASNLFLTLNQNVTEFSDDKIEQNYDTNFTELMDEENINSNIMIEDDIKQLSEDQLTRENVLKNQLDELSKILEVEAQRNIKIEEDAERDAVAMRNLIIEMRIKNGEGNNPGDFSGIFPFLPTNKQGDEKSPGEIAGKVGIH